VSNHCYLGADKSLGGVFTQLTDNQLPVDMRTGLPYQVMIPKIRWEVDPHSQLGRSMVWAISRKPWLIGGFLLASHYRLKWDFEK